MAPFVDLTGKRFGRLKVLHKTDKRSSSGSVIWQCQCVCYQRPLVSTAALRSGQMSCGCLRDEVAADMMTTHGMSYTRTYSSWEHMIQRCYNPNHDSYKDYGGRGTTACERWRNSFEEFHADMGDCPEGMTLDRYPIRDGNYEKGNCRWATPQQQIINTDRVQNAVGVRQTKNGRIQARIERHKRQITLGAYDTEEVAIAVRRKVKEWLDAADAIIAVNLLALPAVAGPLPYRTRTPAAASTMTAAQPCPRSFTTQSIQDVSHLVVVSNRGRFSRRSGALQMRIISVLRGWARRTLAIIFPNPIFSVPSLARGRKR
jgi:hypothetical protein